MILAFGESIVGFALLGLIAASLAVVGRYVHVRSRSRRAGVCLRVATGFAGLVLLTLVASAIREASIDCNPAIESSGSLVGDYAGGGYTLTLKADGTFVASGFRGGGNGNWSRFDWNLTLSGTGLSKPRVIARNGRLCIAPFYAGPDADHGVLLEKR